MLCLFDWQLLWPAELAKSVQSMFEKNLPYMLYPFQVWTLQYLFTDIFQLTSLIQARQLIRQ